MTVPWCVVEAEDECSKRQATNPLCRLLDEERTIKFQKIAVEAERGTYFCRLFPGIVLDSSEKFDLREKIII